VFRSLYLVHKQFRRFDIVVGSLFAVLVIIGVVTVSTSSKPAANSSRTTRATTAAAPTGVRSGTPAPPTTAAAPPTKAAPVAPVGCTPKTDAGNCYEPGEFCRTSDHGASGVAGDGKAIRCEDNDGWRWEPV
jgi:hypothetical protein